MLRWIIVGVLLVCSTVAHANDVQPYDIVLSDEPYVLDVLIEAQGTSQVEIIPRDGLERFVQSKTMIVEETQKIQVEIPVVPAGLYALDVSVSKKERKISTGNLQTYTLRKDVPNVRIETAGNDIQVLVKNKKPAVVQIFVNGIKKAQKVMSDGVIELLQERGQHLARVITPEGVVQKEVRIGLPEISVASLKKDEVVLNMDWNVPQTVTILSVEDGKEKQVREVLVPGKNIMRRPQGNRMVVRFESRTVFLDIQEESGLKLQGAAVIDANVHSKDLNWTVSVCLLVLLVLGTILAARKKESEVDRLAKELARIKRKYEK